MGTEHSGWLKHCNFCPSLASLCLHNTLDGIGQAACAMSCHSEPDAWYQQGLAQGLSAHVSSLGISLECIHMGDPNV